MKKTWLFQLPTLNIFNNAVRKKASMMLAFFIYTDLINDHVSLGIVTKVG